MKKRSIITWRQRKQNGHFESGVVYNGKIPCDEIYFKWVIDGKNKWYFEMTIAEAMEMIRGISSALYYKLSKDEVKKWGKQLNKK